MSTRQREQAAEEFELLQGLRKLREHGCGPFSRAPPVSLQQSDEPASKMVRQWNAAPLLGRTARANVGAGISLMRIHGSALAGGERLVA